MARMHLVPRNPLRKKGYQDLNGDFVPFSKADEVFNRARKLRCRVLLRLWLEGDNELHGLFYTNDKSLTSGT